MSIRIHNLKKWFGDPPTHVLKGIDLTIEDGEFVSIVGRSGSGKSTLLYIMSTLDDPSSGSVFFDNLEASKMSEDAVHDLRNKELGFVFQFHYLLPELTVLENVLMPARKRNLHKEKEAYARELLQQVGLIEHADKKATAISGGEQQRVAIARALVMKPKYLFADEPTGNLDSVNGDNIMNLFKKINAEMGTTVIFVTHDLDYANMAKRKIELVDGVVSENVLR